MVGTFYAGHPLLQGVSDLWLPALSSARGQQFPTWQCGTADNSTRRASLPAKLVGAPTWKNTPFGDGVQTDNLKYIDVSPSPGGRLQISSPSTTAVAYVYKYDASSGAESGILLSCGDGGLSFRHKSSTLECLRSHVASLGTGTATAANGEFHTAVATFSFGATSTLSLYFDGRLVGTGSVNVLMTGLTTACLGYDFSAGTSEFGRHTILGAGHWDAVCWDANKAQQWHQIARQRFAEFFLTRPIFSGAGTPTASTWGPQMTPRRATLVVPELPWQAANRAPAFLLTGGVVGSSDYLPRQFVAGLAAPAVATLRPFLSSGWLMDFAHTNPSPPGGLEKNKALSYIHRVPKYEDYRRLAHAVDVLHQIVNSLVGQGNLAKDDLADWKLLSGAHTETRDPGAMDDGRMGFPVGAAWVNGATKKVWFCVVNTDYAAEWVMIP